MKAFLSACVVAVVIAVASLFVLQTLQVPADTAFSSSTAVRLGS